MAKNLNPANELVRRLEEAHSLADLLTEVDGAAPSRVAKLIRDALENVLPEARDLRDNVYL